ncbi:MAG: DNA polymerase III subunit alpha [Clostridia bacterium]
MDFAHLHCHSPHSLLDGGSSIEDLLYTAAARGIDAMALTDHDSVSGLVEFVRRAGEYGVKPIGGAEVTLESGGHLTLLARNPAGYSRICELLTEAHLGGERGNPRLDPLSLAGSEGDLFVLSGCRRGEIPTLLLKGDKIGALRRARFYRDLLGDSFFLELQPPILPGDRALHRDMVGLGQRLDILPVATADVHYARKADFPIHDILTCIRTATTVSQASPERHLNAENYLKSPEVMHRHFSHIPQAVDNARLIAESCDPVPRLGCRRYPRFEVPGGGEAAKYLRRLVHEGARRRYGSSGGGVSERLERELEVIISMGYADYFLLVEDVVRFARREGIRYSGRGSAADSVVAYCLGITEVDALGRNLLFERFMSPERGEKPDIDIDFDARHRDRVADYVERKYGEDRVASVATFNTFRARSAVRELGKAMEFDKKMVDALARGLPHGSSADEIAEMAEGLPELAGTSDGRIGYETLYRMASRVAGFPRHIATHCGGLVIADRPLRRITPLQMSAKGRLICGFDKEGVEDLGLIKLDLLSLRMLSAIDDTVSGLREDGEEFSYEDIPEDDEQTYDMLRRGETVGVFQLESPAQRSLQSRLGAQNLEDIIASVALIRPGPIKGNMVEPYIDRRHGRREVDYIHPDLEPILKKTYGVVLFQEQVIEIAVAIAGFSPGEADRLRRVMSRSRPGGEMQVLGDLFVEKAEERGIERDTAETIYSYIRGYASYGFCEAHAAAFGMTAYRSAYLARHYPAHYFAALLSNWPMGYYPPNTICTKLRREGISILPVDINSSGARFSVEGGSIRISLSQVSGLGTEGVDEILAAREQGEFSSLRDLVRRVNLPKRAMQNLILCGGLDSLGENRRRLLWRAIGCAGGKRGLARVGDVPDFPPREKILWERKILGIEVSGSYMESLRPRLADAGVLTTAAVREMMEGEKIAVAGTVLLPHRPPTKSGATVVFWSLEDETGLVDILAFPGVYSRYGRLLFPHPGRHMLVRGEVNRRGGGNVTVIARHLELL